MLGSCDLVAFVSVTDGERAGRFYGQTLGLRLRETTPYALVFEANGTMLRVTIAESVTPAPYTVLGWAVPGIADIVAGLVTAGVPLERFEGMEQDERGVWTTPSGDRVAWFRDPDGNLLSVTQYKTPPVLAAVWPPM
jgi:catechol 2,3-dioxygenase-like lactoylglutathione lyase family enzyme